MNRLQTYQRRRELSLWDGRTLIEGRRPWRTLIGVALLAAWAAAVVFG